MPVIINEIEILVEVTPASQSSADHPLGIATGSKDEIIKECVEKVMDLINQKNER